MKQKKRKSGSALIFVLVFMVLGATMGTALIYLTQSDMKAAVANMQYEQSYYDAETAANMATQLAIYKINNRIVGGKYDSPLTYSRSALINIYGDADFADPANDIYIDAGYLKLYEFAWYKQGTTISGFDFQPSQPDAIARNATLQGIAANSIQGALNTLSSEIRSSLSTSSGISATVTITINPTDLERSVYCVDGTEFSSGGGASYNYTVRWALKSDSPIFVDTTVNGRTVRATLCFRGREVAWDSTTGFVSMWSEEARIRVAPPSLPGTGLGSVFDMPMVLVPTNESPTVATNYNSPDTDEAYERLYQGIEPMYREIMGTKVKCVANNDGTIIDHESTDNNGGNDPVITVDTSGGNVSINGEWPFLTRINVLGENVVFFGNGAPSDAFVANALETIHAPEANVVFGDCVLSNMTHCCMETVTFGGDAYGTYIYHSERDPSVKRYCEMVVGDALSVPASPSEAVERVTFTGLVNWLNDVIIFSAGSVGGNVGTVDSNAIFFTAGAHSVPFESSIMMNSPQFYTWGDLSVSDFNGLRGIYACSGRLTVGSWGSSISGYLIGSDIEYTGGTPSAGNCNFPPITVALAPLPDLFAERLRLYTMMHGINNPSTDAFGIISVLTEDMGMEKVSVTTEGQLNDIRIDPGNLFFDGIRELR